MKKTIALKWEDGKWEVKGDHDVDIDVHCNGEGGTTPDPKPNLPEDLSILGSVNVVCDTAPESHNTSYSFKDLSEGAEYTVTEPTPIAGQKDTYQCTVTVNGEKVLEKYNGETGTHTLAGTGSNLGPVTLTWKNNEWTVDNFVKDSLTVKIHCESEPWTPIVPFPTDDNIKALLDGKIKVVCETVKAHGEKNYGAEVEGGYTPSNEIKVDGTNYTYDLTINYNPYVAQYNDDDTSAKHGLVEPDVFSETVTLTWVPNDKELTGGHWAIDDDLLVTIPVQCEYPTLDQNDLANLWVNFFCINDETHNKDHWTNLASCIAETDYHIEYDKEGSAEVTLLNPEQFAKAYCDSTLKVPHLYVGYEPESLTLHWNGENWVSYEVSRSSDANSFTIGILCGPSIARINELLNAQIICVNDDAKHQKTASFDNLLDYSFDVTNLKNDNSVVTAEVVVKPSLYLDKFYNISGGIEHSIVIDNETYPVNEDGSVTVRFSYTGEWNLLYPTRNMVTFPVKCTTQKPIDNPDWEDISALFNDYVTVDCTTGGHNPISYSLVESEVQIGNVYSAAPIVGEESTTYFVPITFNTPDNIRNRVISAYDNSTPNTHSYQSGSIPASITLRYDNENKVWVNEDVKNVLFTVTCTTGGGTIDPNPNPGGGGDNDDDDDRYTGDNTVTRTINDDDVPLNDRPTNTTTIDDEDVPLADLPDDTVTIDDEDVPLKDNPSTGDSLPFAAMAAAALSLGGVIVLNRKKK
ncbi:MAG: doubled motif LPXTG anchor domain-containing protein [Negativibacillus massiliensis]|nr:doubled motif LPXTG anchor domain-containing protein [Negativibacillus massiliensis]